MARTIVMFVVLAGCATRGGHAPSAPSLPASAIVATIPVGTPPTLLAMSPDGSRLFAASSAQLSIIRASDAQVAATVPIPPYTSGVAVTPDGARVLISSVSGVSLTVVDAASGAVRRPIPLIMDMHPGGFERIAVTPDGRRAYVANQVKEYLAIADLRGGPANQSLVDLRPSDVTLTPDGRTLYVTGCREFCTTGTVEALDTATMSTLRSFAVGSSPYRFALSPAGTRAYTTNLAAPGVSIVDVATGTLVGTVPVGVEPTGLAASPDGTRVYVASQTARTLTVIDAQRARGLLRRGPLPGERGRTLAPPVRAERDLMCGGAGAQQDGRRHPVVLWPRMRLASATWRPMRAADIGVPGAHGYRPAGPPPSDRRAPAVTSVGDGDQVPDFGPRWHCGPNAASASIRLLSARGPIDAGVRPLPDAH